MSDLFQRRLWPWAEKAYDAPGAKDRWLELQDRHGQSVCLLLWAAWTQLCEEKLLAASLGEAVEITRAWDAQVIGPVRSARRALKTIVGASDDQRVTLRGQIQYGELFAERTLLEILEALPTGFLTAPADPVVAMTAASQAWGRPAPLDLLTALASAFPPA